MTKRAIWGISLAAVFAVSIVSLLPLQQVTSVQGNQTVRDNLFITDFTSKARELTVLVDNAGIGGTFSAELTWKLSNACQLLQVVGTPPNLTVTPIVDGGELGGNPAHNDVQGIDAIALTSVDPRVDCIINNDNGEYISISTVASVP